MSSASTLVAILPCNDLDSSELFYARLDFAREDAPPEGEADTYRLLADGKGAQLHLTAAVEGWLVPGRNPFGLYLYRDDVDALAARFAGAILGGCTGPEHKPWGMYEFAVSDPDETLVRIGRPSRARGAEAERA